VPRWSAVQDLASWAWLAAIAGFAAASTARHRPVSAPAANCPPR